MGDFVWLHDHLDPHLIEHFTGTFAASADWSACTVELRLSHDGILAGQINVGEQTLELIGTIGKNNRVFGFFLEPLHALHVALFRIQCQCKPIRTRV